MKQTAQSHSSKAESNSSEFLKKIGPGLITGAADDDPSGIATYSQAGSQFGFGMLWTVLFTYPLMVGIQIVSARIGCVTGHGLAYSIRQHYSRRILYSIVTLLLVANTINIAADVSAMGDALKLLIGGSARTYALGFGIASLAFQIIIPYRHYVFVLKWLTLSLLAYVATAFTIHVPWSGVLTSLVHPDFAWNKDSITMIVAIFGTTISPYMFFWQASQEVEDQNSNPLAKPLRKAPLLAKENFHRIKLDTYLGMGVSNLIAFFIILTTAITLRSHGITNIETSAQAATALRPFAGDFAFLLFSLGIIGTGLLAVPVLAGSSAYAMAEARKWKGSLELKPQDAKRFYGIIAIATLGGVALNYTDINPMKALYWSAVINGVISVPIMAIMMLMAGRKDIMGSLTIRRKLKVLGWTAVIAMSLVVGAMFVTMLW